MKKILGIAAAAALLAFSGIAPANAGVHIGIGIGGGYGYGYHRPVIVVPVVPYAPSCGWVMVPARDAYGMVQRDIYGRVIMVRRPAC